jgi:hypothetical protein
MKPIRWWWDATLGRPLSHARLAFKRGRALCGVVPSPRAKIVGDFPRCAACVDAVLAEGRITPSDPRVRGRKSRGKP